MVEEGNKPNYGVIAIVVILIVAVFVVPRVIRRGQPGQNGGTPVAPATTSMPTGSQSFDEAVARAKAEKKRMYVEFSATWCSACAVFKSQVLSDPEVKDGLKNVVFLTVDVDKDPKLAEQFGVNAIPAGFLLNVNNGSLQVLDRHEGMLDKKEFMTFLARKG